jgi:outer membrane protein assembly factor BamB
LKSKVSCILVLLLLASVFVLGSNFQPAKAGVSSQAGLAHAADTDWWPMFHHDLIHSGYSTSAAPKTNQTLWTYNTSGYVDSSPAVVNGTVYVGSNDDNVYALNATTGALAWKYKTGGGVDSSPAVAGGVVYIGSEDDNVYALNATTGALVWKYTTGGEVESSPAVTGGVVYVGSDNENVYALNVSTGTLVWNCTTEGPVYSSPAVSNSVVYVSATAPTPQGQGGITYALNASTGTLVWNYTAPSYESLKGWITNSPLVLDDVVFVIAWYEGPIPFGHVFALNASTGAPIWSSGVGGYVGQSDPAVAGGVIFIGTPPPVPFGYGYVFALNASTGTFLWQYASRNSTIFSPSIADGVILVGAGYEYSISGVPFKKYRVLALNASTGSLVWSRTTGGWVESPPAVANGVVYAGSDDGKVYAFGVPPVARVVTSVEGKSAIVEGNVTITSAVVTKNTLSFYASGPSGSIGWINVTFPMVNTTDITVSIDGKQLTPPPFPIITTNGTHYFIYFEFTLSTHSIDIKFAPSVPVGGIYIPVNKVELLAPYIGLTILLAIAVSTVGYVKKRKRHTEINS